MEQFSVANIAKIQAGKHTGSGPAAVGISAAVRSRKTLDKLTSIDNKELHKYLTGAENKVTNRHYLPSADSPQTQ